MMNKNRKISLVQCTQDQFICSQAQHNDRSQRNLNQRIYQSAQTSGKWLRKALRFSAQAAALIAVTAAIITPAHADIRGRKSPEMPPSFLFPLKTGNDVVDTVSQFRTIADWRAADANERYRWMKEVWEQEKKDKAEAEKRGEVYKSRAERNKGRGVDVVPYKMSFTPEQPNTNPSVISYSPFMLHLPAKESSVPYESALYQLKAELQPSQILTKEHVSTLNLAINSSHKTAIPFTKELLPTPLALDRYMQDLAEKLRSSNGALFTTPELKNAALIRASRSLPELKASTTEELIEQLESRITYSTTKHGEINRSSDVPAKAQESLDILLKASAFAENAHLSTLGDAYKENQLVAQQLFISRALSQVNTVKADLDEIPWLLDHYITLIGALESADSPLIYSTLSDISLYITENDARLIEGIVTKEIGPNPIKEGELVTHSFV